MTPTDYNIHQQVYRPTEVETKMRDKEKGRGAFGSFGKKKEGEKEGKEKGPKGRLEDNAGRLEKGVTGILKKFEKKYG